MTGFGLIIAFFGYAILYWGLQALQGNKQGTFFSYVVPFGK